MSESRFRTTDRGRRARRGLVGAATLVLSTSVLAGCQDDSPLSSPLSSEEPSASSTPDPVRVRAELGGNPKSVPVDHDVRISASGATLESVTVESAAGLLKLPGELSKDGNSWTANGRLEPGTVYVVHAVAKTSDGERVTRNSRFHTQDLSLAQQTYASISPLQDETVGVGMPVIVTFDVPVTDKASIEKHMSVTAAPRQPGAWHWLSDQEVHWRPKAYWKAGSDVSVDLDINSIPAGAGIYGQEDRHVDFHIGDANVYKVNMQTDQMRVLQNGSLLRTIPITTGKPGFTTRSGVKVIIEKFRQKRMNSETVGIKKNDPDYYNIAKVEYAMRVTYTGEFVHAAPWSVGSQGHENVSHGCTGMSTADAAWLYAMSRRGDVVEYVGSDRPMTLTNGYGDWNASFADWRSGSALS